MRLIRECAQSFQWPTPRGLLCSREAWPYSGCLPSSQKRTSVFTRTFDYEFQTYRNSSSVAVATDLCCFRVARFSAERMFTLLSGNSERGIFRDWPPSSSSKSFKIAVTIEVCLPFRPVGMFARSVVLNLRFCLGFGIEFSSGCLTDRTLLTHH